MTDAVFVSGWAGPETLFPGLSARLDFVAPFLDGDEAAVIARAAGTVDIVPPSITSVTTSVALVVSVKVWPGLLDCLLGSTT